MNADYRGRLSMLGQLAGAMNKLLPAAVLPSSRSRFQDDSCFQCSIVSSARAQNKLVVSRDQVEWNLILGNKPSLRCAKRSKKLSSTIYANSFTERVERKVASRLFGSKERDRDSLLGGTTRSPLQMRGSACVVACSTETSERGGGTRNKRGEGEDKRIKGVRGPANL